eukprot:403346984
MLMTFYRYYQAQEDLQKLFPPHIMEQRLKKQLKQSIPEVGGILFQMKKVRNEYNGKESEWQAQYEKVIGNNEKQYFINKYLGESNLQNDENQRILYQCSLKREVDDNGDIFIGFYKDESRFYGRYYQRDRIKEGHMSYVMVICIVVNIRMATVMDQAHIIGVMVTSMKDSGQMVTDMVKENLNMQVETSQKEHGKMIKNMEKSFKYMLVKNKKRQYMIWTKKQQEKQQ